MIARGVTLAALLAGTAAAGGQAQVGRRAEGSPAPSSQAADPPAATSPVEITGPDGDPLPPEIRRRLEQELRDHPLPTPAAPSSGATSTLPAPSGASGEVVVTGQRPRGSVVGNIPPQRTFNPLDLRAFGTNDVGELLQALAPQVSSIQGRDDGGPVVLLNGKRVSSFAEIQKIPTEAIERLEVFPEELALKYGYRADQKVVNVVAFERFSSRIGRVSYVAATEGGRDTPGINANYLRIRGDTRVNIDAEYAKSGILLESERGIRQIGGDWAAGRFRSLLPASERVALNGTVSGSIVDDVSSTLNVRLETSDGDSLLGLGGAGPLRRSLDTRTTHVGTTHGGALGTWSWTFTGNYDRATTDTDTDRNDGVIDRARAINAVGNADLLASGTPAELPAGPVSTTVRAGFEVRDFTGRSSTGGVERRAALDRDRGSLQVSVDLPLASRRRDRGGSLGSLSLNVNGTVQRLSDAGTLRTIGYGAVWSPMPPISIVASVTHEEGAPTVEQLGAPPVVTPNARVFDFARREVVDVTRIFGGNRRLRADDRHVVKLGVTVKPLPTTDLTFSIDYVATSIDNPIAAFPIATAQIEAALPDRFARDAAGSLTRIDSSPLNFARSDQRQMRWGVNFTRPLGPVPPGMRNAAPRVVSSEADLQRALGPNARVMMAPPGSAVARKFENAASRLTLSLYHLWRLRDEILIRPGVPVLDLLDGSAVDARGGRPRHVIEFQASAYKRGMGARVTANWQAGTRVDGVTGAAGTAGSLDFADYAIANVDLFANLADRLGGAAAPSWAKGTRVSLSVVNVFNNRPRIRDDDGATPLAFQPAYLDPLGRIVNLSIRKVF